MNNNLRETKYKNFAPRLGATYALGDKTVIRSGVGLYYMEDIGNAEYFDMARITAARVDNQASATNLITWANAAPGGGTASVPPTLSWAAAYDHATPRTWQYLVNVERQLAANWSVEVGYLGSQSRHLYGFQTLNQAGPGPDRHDQLARALSELRRDLVCDRPEQRALQRVQHQGDAPLR
jgi:hypothetical protein